MSCDARFHGKSDHSQGVNVLPYLRKEQPQLSTSYKMGNCPSRLAKKKTTSKLLALPRELRNNIYDKIPRDLRIERHWNT